jgi:glycosyltransferase involved in cell wall biosynthesis
MHNRRLPASAFARLKTEFDIPYYRATTPEVAAQGTDPVGHYNKVGWRKGLDPSPLFCTRHYLAANPDVAQAKINPFKHFVTTGRYEGRPSAPALFDPEFYARNNPEVAAGHRSAIEHYCRVGKREGRQPSPLFDVAFYRAQLSPSDSLQADTLEHYLTVGWQKGLSPHPLFDPEFYQAQLPVKEAKSVPPLAHYLAIGWRMGLSPHPLFDPDYYVRFAPAEAKDICPLVHYLTMADQGSLPHYLFSEIYYKTLAELSFKNDPRKQYRAGQGPALLHYIKFGAKQRLNTHPLFDANYYLKQLEQWASKNNAKDTLSKLDGSDLLRHYVEVGVGLGLNPTPLFFPDFYRSQFDDEIGGDPLRHYLLPEGFSRASPHPAIDLDYYAVHASDFSLSSSPSIVHLLATAPSERVSPHPLFDPETYRSDNPDIKPSALCPIAHFLTHGMVEGRPPNRWFSDQYVYKLFPSTPFFKENAVEFYLSSRIRERTLIIFTGHSATRTGAPLILLRLVQFFSRLENVECLTILDEGGELLDDFRRCSHVYVTRRRDRSFLDYHQHSPEFKKEFEDVIERVHGRRRVLCICNSAETRHMANILAGFGFPVLGLVHEAADPYPPRQMQDMYDACELVVVPSKYVLDKAERKGPLPPTKMVVRSQGLVPQRFGLANRVEARRDIRRELGIPNNALIVLGCGRIEWRKGTDLFVEVAARVLAAADDLPDAEIHFVWVGEGPNNYDSTWYWANQLTAEQRFDQRVHFVGPRPDTESYYLSGDVFALTSRIDPMPCVVHEAMACGLPVVAFEGKSGAPEAFRQSGVTVPFDAGEMADAVLSLLRDDARREVLGREARSIVETDYRFSDYFDDLRKLISERMDIDLTSSPKPRGRAAVRKRKVHFSASDWSISGVHTFTESLVDGLNERGFDAKIIFTPGRFAPPDREMELYLPSVPYEFLRPKSGLPEHVWQEMLTFFGEQTHPCIYVPNFDFLASATSPLLPEHVGIVGIVHSDDITHYEHVYRLGLYWDRIVSVSQRIAEQVCADNAGFAQKHSVIRYGVPFDRAAAKKAVALRQKKTAEDPLHIVYAGRFKNHQKRIFDYAKVARQLVAADVNFTMTMIGDGDDFDQFRSEAADLLAMNVLRLPGRVSSAAIRDILRTGDVMMLLSDFEGLPLSMLEAMALGCIPIVWNIESGVSEVINSGVNGFSVEKFDFAALVQLLATLQKQRRDVASMSRAVVNSFAEQNLDVGSMVDKYAALFGELLDQLERGTEPRHRPLSYNAKYEGILPPPWLQFGSH